MGTAKRDARDRARQLIAQQRRAQQRRRQLFMALAAVGAVVAVAVVFVVIRAAGGKHTTAAAPDPTGSAAAVVSQKVTAVPAGVLDQVGKGSGVGKIPSAITGQPALTADGKPLVLYIGAEYCPYCAAERWAVVVALSRFGTFKNLGVTHSGSDDVYPNTATLSFHGATYTSDVLAFQGVETQTNIRSGGQYTTLDPLTPDQEAVLRKYDAPPYVPSESAGAIPFLDMGNKYMLDGAGFSPQLLSGLSADQIADDLQGTNTDVARAALGSANALTTALCKLTGNQPSTVCSSAAATAYSDKLS